MSKKPSTPTPAVTGKSELDQELLRAALVANEMLQAMHKILTRLLEPEVKPSESVPDGIDTRDQYDRWKATQKPSETPAETIETLAMKAANGPKPTAEAEKLERVAIEREVDEVARRLREAGPVPPSPLDEPKGPTLADLKKALQDCIAAHDQETARKCIAPYPTYSLVPLDKLPEVIARVEAATRSVVP